MVNNLKEELEKKRDEFAIIVKNHFSKIGASTDDIFKYGWDACANILNKENAELKAQLENTLNGISISFKIYENKMSELKAQLEIAKEALKEIEQGEEYEPYNKQNWYMDRNDMQVKAQEALLKLKTTGE